MMKTIINRIVFTFLLLTFTLTVNASAGTISISGATLNAGETKTLSINISLIKMLGLPAAAYCSEIFSILKKAITKDKLKEEGSIKVDREYVESRTGLSAKEQLEIENILSRNKFIEKVSSSDDVFVVNVPLFVQLISGSDDLSKTEFEKLRRKYKSKKESQEAKKQSIATAIKDGIIYPDLQVKEKLCEWVDTIFATTKLQLTSKIVDVFIATLNAYVQGDMDKALKIVQIAINQSFRDCTWAINSYERSLNMSKSTTATNTPRVTRQDRATKDDITGGEEF